MRRIPVLVLSATMVACAVVSMSFSAGGADGEGSPIFDVKIPAGYRHWELIAVAHESGLDELRGVLGNALSLDAYRQGTLPFPDGTIFVKLAWKHVPYAGVDGAFVTGDATTVQVMVKGSKKSASTGGWGFGKFINGMPVSEAEHKTCFGCHEAHVKDHDFVFTRFAP